MMIKTFVTKTTGIIFLLNISFLFSYPSYPGCADLQDSDFRQVTLVDNQNHPDIMEPIELAFDPVTDNQGKMYVNIYFVERRGKIQLYNAQTQSISEVGSLDVVWGISTGDSRPYRDLGVVGLALDPNFKNNQWIYVLNHPNTLEMNMELRLSRFTLSNNKMVMSSEKVIMSIPYLRVCCHTGGGMEFDDFGNLWFGVGNNTTNRPFFDEQDSSGSDEWGSASTAGLRGGINRITPIPFPDSENPTTGLGRTYTVPEGNFGDFWGDYYQNLGDNAKAAEYRDTKKVLPEIFAKGLRQPFTVTLDPVRQWVTWGGCGPDVSLGNTEEHTMLTEPAFSGWPYFSGKNISLESTTQTSVHGNVQSDPNAIINQSVWNKGVRELPPAAPATYTYPRSCAMTGPIVRYLPEVNNNVKMPPHLNRQWLITDFKTGWVRGVTMENSGKNALSDEQFFNSLSFATPVEFEMGPDGALYIINYAGWYGTSSGQNISRIEYTGSCRPDQNDFTGIYEMAGCKDPLFQEYDSAVTHHAPIKCLNPVSIINIQSQHPKSITYDIFLKRFLVHSNKNHSLEIRNAKGKVFFSNRGKGNYTYSPGEIISPGLYFIRFKEGKKVYSFQSLL